MFFYASLKKPRYNISNRYMKTKTRYVLCGLLAQGPQTGYQLKKLIDERFKAFWNESYGQIYPELKSMLEDEWIEIIDKKNNARKNTIYRITELGYFELKKWMEIKPEKESVRLEILLKTYFSSLTSKKTIESYLIQFKKEHDEDLKQLIQLRKSLDLEKTEQKDLINVINFGIRVNEAYLHWCDENLTKGLI